MSEYERVKQIIRRMRLPREAAQEQARRAFGADMAAGRPDVALLCAKEYDLGNEFLTKAAGELFLVLVRQGRFRAAYSILRGYSLLETGAQQTRAANVAHNLDRLPANVVQKLSDEDRDGLRKIVRRSQKMKRRKLQINDIDQAIDLIDAAAKARDADEKVVGRAVILPEQGDLMLCGDFHGNTDNLVRFANLADLDNNPQRILVIQEILHARVLAKDQRDLSFDTILYALDLQMRYPGQVYYLIGNHDLGFHLGKDLIKAGKSLNRYLYKGMHYQFGDQYERVVDAYKDFIANMPVGIFTNNGVFMSHSTPKRSQMEGMSEEYLTEVAADRPFRKCKPIVALVNGRDYALESAEAFADIMEVEHLIVGHTPTVKGVKIPNKHHIIIDSQHANARYIHFDLGRDYTHNEMVQQVQVLQKNRSSSGVVGELV